jgi:hypothetical protein
MSEPSSSPSSPREVLLGNGLHKYSYFNLFHGDSDGEEEACLGFTKRMASLVDAEEAAAVASEPAMADRLARALMHGLPGNYLLPGRTNLFRSPILTRNVTEMELLR